MEAVLGLVEDGRLGTINDLVGDLKAAVAGEAVQVDGLRVGQFHEVGIADPVPVALKDFLGFLRAVLAHGGLEHGHGGPGLGIDDVRPLHRLAHVVADGEGAAIAPGIVPAGLQHFGVEFHALGMGEHHVHTHHRGGDDGALGHGPGLVDARGIGPTHHELDPSEAAELFPDGKDVGQGLEGVVLVVFHIQDGDVGPVGKVADHLVGSAIDPVHRVAVAADGDGVAHAREHPGHIGDALGGIGHLAARQGRGVDLLRVEVVGMAAQLGHAGLEGVTGAQALVVKDHEEGLAAQEMVVRFAHGEAALQVQGHIEDGLHFLAAPLQKRDKVAASERFGLHLCLLWTYLLTSTPGWYRSGKTRRPPGEDAHRYIPSPGPGAFSQKRSIR